MDLVFIPRTFWYVCNIFSNLYKIPCLWVDRFIFILSFSFHCRFAKVTLSALSPHPSIVTFGGFAFDGNLARTLGHLIALLMNVSRGSITIVNNILYPTSRSFVQGIFVMVNYIRNYFASLINYSYSFYCIFFFILLHGYMV
jgi:hypothetical protein